jgi:hypothetical protein
VKCAQQNDGSGTSPLDISRHGAAHAHLPDERARILENDDNGAPPYLSDRLRCDVSRLSHGQHFFGTAILRRVGRCGLAALYGAPSVAEDITLQEVIVTATRRSESAQDIPASITAVTGIALEQAGIADTNALAHSLAGINVTDKGPFGGVNGSTLIVRGLNSDSTSGEFIQSSPIVQPVATYVRRHAAVCQSTAAGSRPG